MQLSRRQLLCHTGVAAAGLALARGPAAAAPARPRIRLTGNENPYGPPEAARRAIVLGAGDANRYVRLDDVETLRAALEARGADDYAEILLGGGETSLVHRPLKEWEARLPEKRFARIHRTVIVNLDFVERVERVRDEHYQVIVRGVAEPLPMSRRHAARLKLELG